MHLDWCYKKYLFTYFIKLYTRVSNFYTFYISKFKIQNIMFILFYYNFFC